METHALTRDRSCFPFRAGIIFPSSGKGSLSAWSHPHACVGTRHLLGCSFPSILWGAADSHSLHIWNHGLPFKFWVMPFPSSLASFSLSFHPEQTSWTRDAAEEIWPFSRKPAVAVTAVSQTLSVTSHYYCVSCYCCLLFQESHHLLALSMFYCPISSCTESYNLNLTSQSPLSPPWHVPILLHLSPQPGRARHTTAAISISTQLVSFSGCLSGLLQALTRAGRSPRSIHFLPVPGHCSISSVTREAEGIAHLWVSSSLLCVFSAAQLIMARKPCSDFVNSHQGRRKFTKSCQ